MKKNFIRIFATCMALIMVFSSTIAFAENENGKTINKSDIINYVEKNVEEVTALDNDGDNYLNVNDDSLPYTDIKIQDSELQKIEYNDLYPGVTLVQVDNKKLSSAHQSISSVLDLNDFAEADAQPQAKMNAPKVLINDLIKEEALTQKNDSIVLKAAVAASTPSLTITSKTATSITFNVVYPTSGTKYNIITLLDFNQGESNFSYNDFGGNQYRTNGTYTISGLVSGGMYQVGMMWASPDGTYYGGEYTIFRRAQLPHNTTETLTKNDGTYVFTNIESADKAFASTANFNTWLSRMDSAYIALKDLTGYTPYNGNKIEIRSTREDMNTSPFYNVDGQNYWYLTWGYSGNPAKVTEYYYKSLMKRLANGDWGDCPIHEMSHDFDSYVWEFDPEVLADLKEYYVVEL